MNHESARILSLDKSLDVAIDTNIRNTTGIDIVVVTFYLDRV